MTAVTRSICRLFPDLGIGYVPIGKTATSSVKRELMRASGVDVRDMTVEQVHAQARSRFQASTPEEARQQGYTVLAFVRNPFDRLVSIWSNKVDHPHIPTGTVLSEHLDTPPGTPFRDFVAAVERVGVLSEGHIAPQTYHLGQEGADFLGRYERLETDWEAFRSRFPGLRPLGLPINQRHFRGVYRDLYAGDLRGRVETLYRDDLDLLGYSF